MNLIDALENHAEKLHSQWFLRNLRNSEMVYVQSCRIHVGQVEQPDRYRVTILIRAKDIVQADAILDRHLEQLTCDWLIESNGELEVKKLKPRPLLQETLELESDTVLELLSRIRRESARVASTVELVNHDLAKSAACRIWSPEDSMRSST